MLHELARHFRVVDVLAMKLNHHLVGHENVCARTEPGREKEGAERELLVFFVGTYRFNRARRLAQPWVELFGDE